jgi:hypothetical protein
MATRFTPGVRRGTDRSFCVLDDDASRSGEAPFCVLHEAHQAVILSPRSVRPAGTSMKAERDYVALAMMSTAGGSPSRSTVEPVVPPHFGGVVAVAVIGLA